jgi:ABC-type lipoprotein export system ATPase subunit/ABC-type antimicrobial peptide transport system permease subunit
MELIRCRNICKTYHVGEIDVPVLKGVSFSIRRGELVALMGASGSGKTTLMNILGCLDRPTSGEYWLDGQEISQLSSDARALVRTAKLGFVFQSFNLLARTTAVNNVLMPLDYATKRRSVSKAMRRALDLLERVGLGDRLDHVPSQMSGGQQQRVAIARALINEPDLLLADEPTGNLDSKTSVEILEMFQELNAQGITVILVTHDSKVAEYAHRVIHVKDGLIEEDETRPAGNRALPPPHMEHLARTAGHNGGPHGHVGASNGDDQARGASVGNGVSRADDRDEAWDADPHPGGSGGAAVGTRTAIRAKRRTAVASAPHEVEVEAPAETHAHHGFMRQALARLIPATLRTAFGALRRNKMRSMLTTLGIIIGVSAVIAIFEISSGSREALIKTMSSMGANMLIVQSGAAASGGVSWGIGSEKTLTPEDAEQIKAQCSAVVAVAPIVQASGQVVYQNRNWIPANMSGTSPEYLIVRDWQNMHDGEMFTERDVLSSNKVCVLGLTLAKELFPGESPVGKDVRVNNVSLRVVGVLGRKGGSMMGMDQDDILVAPWTTMKYRISSAGGAAAAAMASSTPTTPGYDKVNSLNQLYPGATKLYPEQSISQKANTPMPIRFTNVDIILVKAASADRTQEAVSEVEGLLHERHRIQPNEEDDFSIRDMAEIINAMSSMTKMMGGLLMIVAAISLAVGGVGIMNIMLVSVTERTREIGLRMAVGARAKHILRQFLIESVVLCLFGGAIGILLGRGATMLVYLFLRWPVAASIPAIVAAFAVSAGVGIAFGFYPAWKASRLDPIDALRYE